MGIGNPQVVCDEEHAHILVPGIPPFGFTVAPEGVRRFIVRIQLLKYVQQRLQEFQAAPVSDALSRNTGCLQDLLQKTIGHTLPNLMEGLASSKEACSVMARGTTCASFASCG